MTRHLRGRHLYVVGNSEVAASLLGIRKPVAWCWAFALSGVLVALSGLLQLATTTQMQSTLGEDVGIGCNRDRSDWRCVHYGWSGFCCGRCS